MATLKCSRCGLVATQQNGFALIAKPGGTHYQRHNRERDPRKTEGAFSRATTCGKWVEVKP